MSVADDIRKAFFSRLDRPIIAEKLFDQVPDITFFVKDHLARYVAVNKTLCDRCGVSSKAEIIGKTTEQLYPGHLSSIFAEQDQQVLKKAHSINARLELHLYSDGSEGWCLTYKEPILDKDKLIIGVTGISRDLHGFAEKHEDFASVSKVLRYIVKNVDKPLRLPELAKMVDLSVYQLDQRIRAIYQISSGQLITRARVEAACHMLRATGKSIATIAQDCGYSDQSAFSRQFKQTTGYTPKCYREWRE